MASSSKRLQNDVLNYESSSDRKIASNMYYIVCIHLETNSDGPSLIKKLIRQDFEGDGAPLAAYTYFNDVYLVFSSLEESKGEHYLGGSHQKICSYFASSIARLIDMNIVCSIVELDSRTKVLVYFQTKIYENAKKSIMVLLKGKVKRKEIDSLSMFELLELLKKHSIIWTDLPSIERFGMFYKYIQVEGEKGKLSTLSELIDIREIRKYTTYLFN
jgi:hypothetical protein